MQEFFCCKWTPHVERKKMVVFEKERRKSDSSINYIHVGLDDHPKPKFFASHESRE